MQTQPAKKPRPQKKKRQHDPVYRRIFNRAQMIEEILRRFATGPWAAHLDFSTLAPVPAHFVTDSISLRASGTTPQEVPGRRHLAGSLRTGQGRLVLRLRPDGVGESSLLSVEKLTVA